MCHQPPDQGPDQPARQVADEANESAIPPPPKLDPEDYLHHLDEFDMTEAQKVELLQTLWTIMATMVDLGFGADSVQYFLPELFKNENENANEKGIDHEP